MRQRGKKSAAELSILRLEPAKRDPPPASLLPEAAAEWVAIMNRMPAGWIGREMHPLLAAYCEHVVESRHISSMLATLDEALAVEVDRGRPQVRILCESMDTRRRLLQMRDRETRAASSLATRLRMTPQSAYDKTKAATAARLPDEVPWENLIGGNAIPRT